MMFTVWRLGSDGSFEPDLPYPLLGVVLAYFFKAEFPVQSCSGTIIQSGFYGEAGSMIRFKYKFQHGAANTTPEILWMHYQALDMGRMR